MPRDEEDFTQPISVTAQQTGVASARETAAERGNSTLAEVETSVPANDEVTVNNVQQQLQLPAILESLNMYSIEPHQSATYVELLIDVDGDGVAESTPLITPRIAAESFNPGAGAGPGVQVDIRLVNNGGTATTMGAQALFREI